MHYSIIIANPNFPLKYRRRIVYFHRAVPSVEGLIPQSKRGLHLVNQRTQALIRYI